MPTPPKRRTGLIVGAIVAVIALLGGGVALTFALQSSSTKAAATPSEAVDGLVQSLAKNDLVGLLDSLHPGESKWMREMTTSMASEFKRLEIMRPDVDPLKMPEGSFKAENIEFDKAGEEKVNDHLVINKLVKGKITVRNDLDAMKAQYTEKFAKLFEQLLANPLAKGLAEKETVYDIEKLAKENGGPIGIATVKVDNRWHPSFFYSIADAAFKEEKLSWPKESVPAKGADTPDQAVREMVTAVIDQDIRRVVELLPAQEMAVVHDLGPMLVSAFKPGASAKAKLIELKTTTTDVPGGKRISPTKLVFEADGQRMEFERKGECVEFVIDDEPDQICAQDYVAEMALDLKRFRTELPPAAAAILKKVLVSMLDVGVVTVEEGGKHYISPTGTLSELFLTFLRGLTPADIDELLKGFK